MRKLKILISAYACEPVKGSEPSVGWNLALEIAKYHEVWVMTRANNRVKIERELLNHRLPNIHFIYYDLPSWISRWKKGEIGIRIYYYLWQVGIYFVAKEVQEEVRFDIAHHVTFVKYWAPSLISRLPIPFLWGPVGGGDSMPSRFFDELSVYGKIYEKLREVARGISEWDPLVRETARNSRLSLATTRETAERLKSLGSQRIEIFSQCGLSATEVYQLGTERIPRDCPFRLISIGSLLPVKGFHLGLRAFAEANLPKVEYWIVGEGPERKHLKKLARRLGIADRIIFYGKLSRQDSFRRLKECHVLIHPSLHDSGGLVCLESMAAGNPVICLDHAGPGLLVKEGAGIKIKAVDSAQVVGDMAEAIVKLQENPTLMEKMGQCGRDLMAREYSWERKAQQLLDCYDRVLETHIGV